MITLHIHRILVPVDFTPVSDRAYVPAAQMARQCNCELLLLHVKTNTKSEASRHPLNLSGTAGISPVEKTLNEVASELRSAFGIRVRTSVVNGKVIPEILRAVKQHDVGLVVMGTAGDESSSSIFRGANAPRIVSKIKVPVITVRTAPARDAISRILLPVDLSIHSRQKVNAALALASKFGAQLHVLGLLGRHASEDKFKLTIILNQIRQYAEDRNLVFSSRIAETDYPARKTMAWANQLNADLIVVMTDENGGTRTFGVDSFDEQLVNESPVAVLSVHPEQHEENIELATIAGLG